MTVVGLRELRRRACDLVRRVEAGEEVTITVAGRATARLVPATTRSWRTWSDVEELFSGPPTRPGNGTATSPTPGSASARDRDQGGPPRLTGAS